MFFYVDCHVVKIIVYSKKNDLEKNRTVIGVQVLVDGFFWKMIMRCKMSNVEKNYNML